MTSNVILGHIAPGQLQVTVGPLRGCVYRCGPHHQPASQHRRLSSNWRGMGLLVVMEELAKSHVRMFVSFSGVAMGEFAVRYGGSGVPFGFFVVAMTMLMSGFMVMMRCGCVVARSGMMMF